jgi:hypothetical protein
MIVAVALAIEEAAKMETEEAATATAEDAAHHYVTTEADQSA